MQFGIFTVVDITTDPATGKAPSEHQRIKNTVEMAVLAEQAGLDFFATGEHHNPPFAPSSPTTLLANIAARTDKLLLTTATTLITTNDPVRLAEEYAYLQHLADGRVDLMMGRGNTGPVYPWFGKDIRKGISLAVENYDLLRRLWRETNVDWEGEFRTALQDFTSMPRPLDGVPPFVWHASIRSPQIAEQAAYYGDGYLHNNIFWPIDHVKKMVDLYRERFAFYGHGRSEQAIVGLGGVPHKEIMKQIEYLGSEIVPALRAELEPTKPEGVPDAPLHPRHRALLEGAEPPAEGPFSMSNEFDPLTGRKVRI